MRCSEGCQEKIKYVLMEDVQNYPLLCREQLDVITIYVPRCFRNAVCHGRKIHIY